MPLCYALAKRPPWPNRRHRASKKTHALSELGRIFGELRRVLVSIGLECQRFPKVKILDVARFCRIGERGVNCSRSGVGAVLDDERQVAGTRTYFTAVVVM